MPARSGSSAAILDASGARSPPGSAANCRTRTCPSGCASARPSSCSPTGACRGTRWREWGLDGLWGKSFGSLSGGQRQRLFIALALVNEPEIVFLDELTQGLDPSARRVVWDLVRRIRDRGTTVVLVTHFTDEAEILCDRVVVMRDGGLVAHGSPAELVEQYGPGVGVSFTDPHAEAADLRSICGVRSVGLSGDRVELRGDRRMLAHVGAHLVDASRARGTTGADRPVTSTSRPSKTPCSS